MDVPTASLPLPARALDAWRRRGPRYVWHKALRRAGPLARRPGWKRRLVYADPRALLDPPRRRRLFPGAGGPAGPGRTARAWLADRVAAYRPGLDPGGRLRLRQAAPGAPAPWADVPMVGVDFSPTPARPRPGATSPASTGSAWPWPRATRLPFADGAFDLVLTSAVILHNPPPVAERIRREVVRVARRWAAHNEDTDVTYNRFGYDTAAWYREAGDPAGRGRADPDRRRSPGRPRSSAWPSCGVADPDRARRRPIRAARRGRAVRDSLIVTSAARSSGSLGTLTALALRWGLDPARLGVYTGLRLYLDNTNRSSLGVGLGAVQEIPILRAAGREAEARRVADVAYTTNTLTCLALCGGACSSGPGCGRRSWPATRWRPSGPGAWWRWPALALLKRYQDFLIAVLRAHQEFALTTELDDPRVAGLGRPRRSSGLWLAGFWGLLGGGRADPAGFKIAYLHAPAPAAVPLGLGPADGLAADAGRPADPGQHGGLRRGAEPRPRADPLARARRRARRRASTRSPLMGTSWSLDLAGRIVTVMYTYFQTTLGRTRDPAEVARQAARAAEAQAPVAGGRGGGGLPRRPGLPRGADAPLRRGPAGAPAAAAGHGAARPGLAGPADADRRRPALPPRPGDAGRPGRDRRAGVVGADRAGIVGVARGMTVGYAAVYLLTGVVGVRAGARAARLARPIRRGSPATSPGSRRRRCWRRTCRWPGSPAGPSSPPAAGILLALGLPPLWAWGTATAGAACSAGAADDGPSAFRFDRRGHGCSTSCSPGLAGWSAAVGLRDLPGRQRPVPSTRPTPWPWPCRSGWGRWPWRPSGWPRSAA